MSGSVVKQAETRHACNPGWRWEWTDSPLIPGDEHAEGHYYGVPPTPWDFPAGTVWECECRRTWVSLGSVYYNTPGMCFWRRERWLACWLRTRKAVSGSTTRRT